MILNIIVINKSHYPIALAIHFRERHNNSFKYHSTCIRFRFQNYVFLYKLVTQSCRCWIIYERLSGYQLEIFYQQMGKLNGKFKKLNSIKTDKIIHYQYNVYILLLSKLSEKHHQHLGRNQNDYVN